MLRLAILLLLMVGGLALVVYEMWLTYLIFQAVPSLAAQYLLASMGIHVLFGFSKAVAKDA